MKDTCVAWKCNRSIPPEKYMVDKKREIREAAYFNTYGNFCKQCTAEAETNTRKEGNLRDHLIKSGLLSD